MIVLLATMQYVLVWSDAPRYMRPDKDAPHARLPSTRNGDSHSLAAYRLIGKREGFLEIESLNVFEANQCMPTDGFGLTLRAFVRPEAVAPVTPREVTVKVERVEVTFAAGVAIIPGKAGNGQAFFDNFSMLLPALPEGAVGPSYESTRKFDVGRKALGKVQPPMLFGFKPPPPPFGRPLLVYERKPQGDQVEVTAATPCARFKFMTLPGRISKVDDGVEGSGGIRLGGGVIGLPSSGDEKQPAAAFSVRKGARAYFEDGTIAGSATMGLGFEEMKKVANRLCIDDVFIVCFDKADVKPPARR